MENLLEDLRRWAKTYKDEIPKDAVACANHNQSGQLNSHYGKKHTEETKKLIGSKSVNRNWATGDKTAKKGKENGRAKPVEVLFNDELKKFECLKDFYNQYNKIPYSTMKWMARTGKSSRGLTIKYV